MESPLAKPGITRNDDLARVDLPASMGVARPVAASEHRYCGILILQPGDRFDFHVHPRQTEVIYVLEGTLEGWVESEQTIMVPGDVLVAPVGTVHAIFNTSEEPVQLFAVLDPLIEGVAEEMMMTDRHGWELVDVSGEEPWASLRPRSSPHSPWSARPQRSSCT